MSLQRKVLDQLLIGGWLKDYVDQISHSLIGVILIYWQEKLINNARSIQDERHCSHSGWTVRESDKFQGNDAYVIDKNTSMYLSVPMTLGPRLTMFFLSGLRPRKTNSAYEKKFSGVRKNVHLLYVVAFKRF